MVRERLVRFILVGGFVFGAAMLNPAAWADENADLKQQVRDLQDRVNQLESELGGGGDPFRQMMQINQQMERNMRQAFANSGAVFNPRMDMKKTDKNYIITLDIPGMDKDKINVQVKEGALVISGERQSENEDNQNNQYYRQERSFGSFMQAIPLPDDVKTDSIDAKYRNGVLTVTVARMKKEEKKSEGQKIMVK